MDYWGQIALGTFPFSGAFSRMSGGQIREVIETFIEGGGRCIDTAPLYPNGIEVGQAIKSLPRKDLIISTKCVTGTDSLGQKVRSGAPIHIRNQVISEISRLGCDYIDLLQSHITPEDVPISDFLGAIEDLLSEGLIRHFGVSNVSEAQLKQLNATGRVEWVQNRLSLIHRSSYASIRSYCIENGIRMNPYQVIERGQLLSSCTLDGPLPSADTRTSKPEYRGDANDVVREWFRRTSAVASARFGAEADDLAVGWVLAQKSVQMCVIGATNPHQIKRFLDVHAINNTDLLDYLEKAYGSLQTNVLDIYGVSVEEFRGLAQS